LSGNKAIPEEDLLKALRDNGLAEGQIFRQAVLEGMSRELERQYVGQGRYGATVTADIEELPRNRVGVHIKVDEGEVASIKHINVVGARAFDADEILSLFELKTSNILSWVFNDDKYSKEKLSGDLERIESFYLNRGYLKFSIETTQVAISPDRQSVFVTVNLNEGDVYTVDEIALAGDLVISEGEIRSLVRLKKEQTFSQLEMTNTSEIIKDRLGNEGYTFAEVKGIPEVNEDNKTAKVTFFVNPGKRAYVRRIEFRGNTKTMDEVLRREMRQMEGASASTAKIEHSKVRLNRLGYFKEVQVDTQQVPGTNDQVDVIYTVEEQPSGSIGASVGFAQTYGLVLGANISERNFLGTGNNVSINLNQSAYTTNYGFSASNPYFTRDGIGAGFSVFMRETDYEEVNVSNYSTDSMGGSLTFSYPISDVSSIGFGLGLEVLELKPGSFPSEEILEFIDENGEDFTTFTTSFNWGYSTLNRANLSTAGISHRVAVEFSVPGSDLEYYKTSYAGQYFRPLSESLTLRMSTDLGYGDSYGSGDRLPFFKNYFGGGWGSVRGYKKNTLGPRETPDPDNPFDNDDDPFGGNMLVVGSVEVLFPVPFIKDQRSIQAAAFLDAGNVFDTDCGDKDDDFCQEPDLGDLRYSLGIGGTWISGFGPITASLAFPLNPGGEDEKEVFQFSLGQTF
ncbi:MAG: outer membrane protein assembly factor BamA, partial [Gammaproteobacteria bacterium]